MAGEYETGAARRRRCAPKHRTEAVNEPIQCYLLRKNKLGMIRSLFPHGEICGPVRHVTTNFTRELFRSVALPLRCLAFASMSGSRSASVGRVHVVKADPSGEGGSHSQAQGKGKGKGKGKRKGRGKGNGNGEGKRASSQDSRLIVRITRYFIG